jgi:hypothetical protein
MAPGNAQAGIRFYRGHRLSPVKLRTRPSFKPTVNKTCPFGSYKGGASEAGVIYVCRLAALGRKHAHAEFGSKQQR